MISSRRKHSNNNFISRFGYSTLDYGILKKYLLMPKPYMKGMFQLYPASLQKVPLELSSLLEKCDSYYWNKIKETFKMTEEETVLFVKYKIAGVPPLYMQKNTLPSCSGAVLNIVSKIMENPEGFTKLGRVAYFHSLFEDNSLQAASNIVKECVKVKLKPKMIPFTKYMEAVKTFDDSPIVRAVKDSDLAVVYMVGNEYLAESGFTETHLEELIKLRRTSGKSTIISSHMPPADFAERYKISLDKLGATAFKFEDSTLGLTLLQLGKELDALKGGN